MRLGGAGNDGCAIASRPADVGAGAPIATIWLFCGYVLQTVGLQYTSASNSAFITALYVI